MKTLFGLGLCMMAMISAPVRAQDVVLSSIEPVRFALVIGNAQYGKHVGTLDPLDMACVHDPLHPEESSPDDADGDADVVAKAFVKAGWTDVTKLCNQTADQLRLAIAKFATRVSRTRRALGVIFYSGHGAEVAGRNYLFGIDATVVPQTEVETLRQDKTASLFGDAAIDLSSELRRVGQMYGKGLVLLIDACRNDVLAQDLRAAGIPQARNPTLADEDALQGIVVGFASASGKTAPGSPLGKPTLYARTLVDELAKAAINATPFEEMIGKVDTAVRIKEPGQKPTKVGELNNPPRLCVMGCPQDDSAWLTSEEVSAPAPIKQIRSLRVPVARRSAMAWRGAAMGTTGKPRLRRASLISFQDVDPSPKPAEPSSHPREIGIDILWCAGGTDDKARFDKATKIHDMLISGAPLMALNTNTTHGEPRLLQFPIPLAKRQDISGLRIIADNDEAEQAWAIALRTLAADKYIMRQPRGGKTPDRIELYVCDGADYIGALDTVYFQAPDADTKDALDTIKTELQTNVAGLYVARGTDFRASPDATEVRYFFPAQTEKAKQIADNLAAQLGHPVEPKLVKGYEKQLAGKRVIEAWIGRTETAPVLAAPQ